MAEGAKTLPRVAFAAVALAFPLQLLVARFVDEPYPGLFQPSFAGTPLSDGDLDSVEPLVTVSFADGGEDTVDYELILPPSRLHSLVVFKSAFMNAGRAADPETAAWLAGRMEDLYPLRAVDAITVEWTNVRYVEADHWSPVREIANVVKIPVGDL